LLSATSPEIVGHNGKWHSMLHHGDFSRNTKEELIDAINHSINVNHNRANGCDTVILTFGTAYAYIFNKNNAVAGNCHKLPAKEFTRRLLSIEEIVDSTSAVIERYRKANPNIRFIFTVSPIRHKRDGLHANQLSKATLLLAVDRLCELRKDLCLYFPAYEIMMDELRDYRFYADDMVHPSPLAVEYIWERFSTAFFDRKTMDKATEWRKFEAAQRHRSIIDKVKSKN
jgi:hypothetical protein